MQSNFLYKNFHDNFTHKQAESAATFHLRAKLNRKK